MRNHLRHVRGSPRHLHHAFRGKPKESLLLLLTSIVTVFRATRRYPHAQLGLCLVLEDLLQQRLDAREWPLVCLIPSRRGHVRGKRGEESQRRVNVRVAQIVFSPFGVHQLRVLLASLPCDVVA